MQNNVGRGMRASKDTQTKSSSAARIHREKKYCKISMVVLDLERLLGGGCIRHCHAHDTELHYTLGLSAITRDNPSPVYIVAVPQADQVWLLTLSPVEAVVIPCISVRRPRMRHILSRPVSLGVYRAIVGTASGRGSLVVKEGE